MSDGFCMYYLCAFAEYKGYVNAEMVQKHMGPSSLGDKVKIFVCGALRLTKRSIPRSSLFTFCRRSTWAGSCGRG